MSGVNSLISSAFSVYEFVPRADEHRAPKNRAAATAYPREISACDPGMASGSISVTIIEMELSVLRRISNVRNSWGKSLKDGVSTSQKPYSGLFVSDRKSVV